MRASAGIARAKKSKDDQKKTSDGEEEYVDPSLLAEETHKANKRYNYFWSNIRKMVHVQGLGSMPHEEHAARSLKTEALSRNSSFIKDKLYEQKLFDPQQLSKFIWDLVIAALIFYSVIIIPYRLSFEQSTENITLDSIDYVVTAFFCLDIIITFNTAYVDEQTELLITDRSEIVKQYLSFWFWIDVVSTIPFDLMFEGGQSIRLIRVVRLMRLMRILKLIKLFKSSTLAVYVESINVNPALVNVVKLLVQIFFIAHLIACFWFYLTTQDGMGVSPEVYPDSALIPENDDPHFTNKPWLRSWASEGGFVDEATHVQYVASLHWTITTMVAVGYGDIRATNTRERLFSIFTMLSGGVMFGAVIAQVTRLIESRNPQARAFKLKMSEMKAYLDEKALPLRVKTEAKEAYIYYLQKKSSFGESGIFNSLPKNLLTKLIFYIYEREMSQIKLFQITERAFVRDIITSCQPFQCSRGEIIYNVGDVADSIIFVLKGLVRVCIMDGLYAVTIGYVTEGGFFGDMEFFKRSTQIATYIASTSCNFLSIKTKVIDAAILRHPQSGVEVCRLMRRRFDTFEAARKSGTRKSALSPDSHDEHSGKHGGGLSASTVRTSKMLKRGSVLQVSSNVMSSFGGGGSARVSGRDILQNGDAFKVNMWVDGSLRSYDDMMTYIHSTPFFASQNVYRVIRRDREFEKEFGIRRVIVTEATEDALFHELIIHPKNYIKSYWDAIIGALIIYSVIVIPVQIAFEYTSSLQTSLGQFDVSVDGLFFIDIILCFRTPYFDEDADAFNVIPWDIAAKYCRSWFWIDLASSFPLDLVLEQLLQGGGGNIGSASNLLKTFRLVRLLKLARLLKLTKYISKLEDKIGISPAMFDLCFLMVEVVFIGHLLACFWWGMGGWMDTSAPDSGVLRWYDDPYGYYLGSMRYADMSDQYILSLYWTFATLATVGYGDVVAYTEKERILNIAIMIIGATVFGYIVANVSALMGSLDQHKNLVNERVTEVSEYLHEKNVPVVLRGTIVRHFKHLFNQKSVFDEAGILSRLPTRITQDILATQNAETLRKIAIFKYIENQSVRLFLFQMLRPQYFDADQYLLRENTDVGEILFIVSGQARIYKNKTSSRGAEQRERNGGRGNGTRRRNRHEQVAGNSFSGTTGSTKVLSSADSRNSFSLFGSNKSQPGSQSNSPYASPSTLSRRKVYVEKGADEEDSRSSRADGDSSSIDSYIDMNSFSGKIVHKVQEGVKAMKEQKAAHEHVDASAGGQVEDAFDEEEEKDKATHHQHYTGSFVQFSRVTVHEMEARGWVFLGDVSEGEFVGHVPMMTNSKSHCSVRAITPCSVYSLRVSDIRRLLVEQPQIALVLQSAFTKSINNLSIESKHRYRVNRKHFLVKIKHRFIKTRDKNVRKKPSGSIVSVGLGLQRVASTITTDKGVYGRVSAMGSKFGISRLSLLVSKFTDSRRNDKNNNTSLTSNNSSSAVASDTTVDAPRDAKKMSLERWAKIKQAMKDAKVAATVDSMAANMEAMKNGPSISSHHNDHSHMFEASFFEKAMRARVNNTIAVESILSDANIMYNSDEDEEKEDAIFYSKQIRSRGSSHQFMNSTVDKTHGHTLRHCKKLSTSHRSHRSCGDLTQFADSRLDDLWNVPMSALNVALENWTVDMLEPAAANDGSAVPKLNLVVSSLEDLNKERAFAVSSERNVEMLLSKRRARSRAHSFPSTGNNSWRRKMIYDSIV